MTVKIYDFTHEDAMYIRNAVFVEEQGFVDDGDDIDAVSTHIIIYDEENPIATCRIFKGEKDEEYILGRFAVIKECRGKGIGRYMLDAALKSALKKGATRLILHSQYDKRGFYEKCGFTQFGEIEYEQGCPHIWMGKAVE